MTAVSVLTAPALYALSQGLDPFRGVDDACYWCASPCPRGKYPHTEPVTAIGRQWPIDGSRPTHLPRRPGNGYVCLGCHLWRRPSITVRYLDDAVPRFKDRQTPCHYSWLINRAESIALRANANTIYPTLLKPPCSFVLALREGDAVPNHLHCALANDIAEIKADTPLHFTLNNIPHVYTVYELEMGLRGGKEGTLPGVAALIRLFGAYELPAGYEDKRQANKDFNRKGGRPEPLQDGKVTNRPVTMSGKF